MTCKNHAIFCERRYCGSRPAGHAAVPPWPLDTWRLLNISCVATKVLTISNCYYWADGGDALLCPALSFLIVSLKKPSCICYWDGKLRTFSFHSSPQCTLAVYSSSLFRGEIHLTPSPSRHPIPSSRIIYVRPAGLMHCFSDLSRFLIGI